MVLWLYFDIASPTDGAASFTAASPKTGYIYHGRPAYPAFTGQPNAYGSATPPFRWQHNPTDVRRLFCDIGPSLIVQDWNLNGSVRHEEPAIVAFAASNGGVADTNIWTADSVRLHSFDGRIYASVAVKLGATATDYLDTFTITTTLGRVLTFSATRNVLTPVEG